MQQLWSWEDVINQDRRGFLWLIWLWAVASLSVWTSWAIAETLQLDESIQKSLRNIGYNEWSFLQHTFRIQTAADIKNLQRDLWVGDDGIIGSGTLAEIYIQRYSQMSRLPDFQNSRLGVYRLLQNYSQKQQAVNGRMMQPVWFGDVETMARYAFSPDKSFGGTALENEPRPGTFINSQLYAKFQQEADPDILTLHGQQVKNAVVIERYQWEVILSVYNASGKLVILSLAGAGRNGKPTNPRNMSAIGVINKNHISSEYPEWVGGYPMPYSTDAFNGTGERIHGSIDEADGRNTSSGCIRLPLMYAEAVYRYIEQYSPKLIFPGG